MPLACDTHFRKSLQHCSALEKSDLLATELGKNRLELHPDLVGNSRPLVDKEAKKAITTDHIFRVAPTANERKVS